MSRKAQVCDKTRGLGIGVREGCLMGIAVGVAVGVGVAAVSAGVETMKMLKRDN